MFASLPVAELALETVGMGGGIGTWLVAAHPTKSTEPK